MVQIEISAIGHITNAVEEAQNKMIAGCIKHGYFIFNELRE